MNTQLNVKPVLFQKVPFSLNTVFSLHTIKLKVFSLHTIKLKVFSLHTIKLKVFSLHTIN